MCFMNLHRDRLPIIQYAHFILTNVNLNLSHFLVSLVVVRSIDQYLIEYLEHSWDIFDLLEDDLVIL